MYWRYDFALAIKFGSPELKAQLVWNENVRVRFWCPGHMLMTFQFQKGVERRLVAFQFLWTI